MLLRGWSREARHWGEFPTQLRAAVGGEVVALDLPGNGAAHRLPSPTRVREAMEAARCALAARGIAAPVNLLGLSMGAMVCIEWAHRHPGEVARCVLLNTSARPHAALRERLKPSTYLRVAGALLARDVHVREHAILGLTSAQPAQHARVLGDWVAYAGQFPVSRRNALRQLLAAARYAAPRQRPEVPFLVLAGAADRLVDPVCSERLAMHWNVPFASKPGAGHDLTLDAGMWVARQVASWIRPT